MSAPGSPHNDEFIRLFTAHEAVLRAFVRSLVPSVADANDVMQEAAVVLWHKFGEYRPGSDFRAWAFNVVRFKVLSWSRDRARERLVLSAETLDVLAQEADGRAALLEARREALQTCIGKLRAEERGIIESVYASGRKIDEVARQLGRSAMALYKQLHRIRLALAHCTRAALAREGLIP